MESKEKLKIDIKEYLKKNGWRGLFGILAEISPEKIDEEDLKKYNETISEPTIMPKFPEGYTQGNDTVVVPMGINNASIYAEEHLPAVQEDIQEHGQNDIASEERNHSKIKVLENKTMLSMPEAPKIPNKTPNPWSDAKTVLPGEVKDMLIR